MKSGLLLLIVRYKKTCALFLLLVLVYIGQSFLVSPDKAALAKYHISAAEAHWLSATIVIPYVVIWIIALTGYIRLDSYANGIRKSRDGAAFKRIAQGVGGFVFWLPLTAILSNFSTQYYGQHHSATANLVRFNNYVALLVLLIGFVLVYRGSVALLSSARPRLQVPFRLSVMLTFIAFAALYVLLSLQDPARRLPAHDVSVASYYEPDWLITLTLLIPRLFEWFLGVVAIQNIMRYRQKVKGSIYRQALNNLAIGLAGVVLMTIVLRCVQSLSVPLEQAGLGLLLVVIYLLLIALSVGYIYIASGAKRLQKLEEL